MVGIDNGFYIKAKKQEKSWAYANKNWLEHPQNTGKLIIYDNDLCFAGGDDYYFRLVEMEIWGLN